MVLSNFLELLSSFPRSPCGTARAVAAAVRLGRDGRSFLLRRRGSGHRIGSGGDGCFLDHPQGRPCHPMALGGSLIRPIREVGLKPPAGAAPTETRGADRSACAS